MKLPDHWFYGSAIGSSTFSFDEDEMRHATKALRLKVADEIQWTDGLGGRFKGVISSVQRTSMQAIAKESSREETSVSLILGVGILHDSTRLEWLIEKVTELGTTKIVLLQADRSERSKYKIRRLEAKALSAMKQSGRAWLPELVESTLENFLADIPAGSMFIAHCYESLERIELKDAMARNRLGQCLLIGPEGDFTEQEIEKAQAAGFVAVSLGSARLRTETAAVAGIVLLSQLG